MFALSRFYFTLGLIVAGGSQTAVAAAPPVVADAQIAFALRLGNPQGIAVSNEGVIYVGTASNRVVTTSSTGVVSPVSITGFISNGPGAFTVDSAGEVPNSGNPALIAGAPINGTLYVCNTLSH